MHHLQTIELLYQGDCSLLGLTPDFHLYVEELVDDWTAQHIVTLQGQFLKTVDEHENPEVQLLTVPPDAVKPQAARLSADLNFTGGRLRGLREPERVQDWVLPLSVAERMLLASRLGVSTILGIAESVVLSEALVDGLVLVCRRVRIAYALPQPRLDAERQPYDYDTAALYLAHFHEDDLSQALNGLALNRPMDCIALDGHVVIADGGGETRKNCVQVFSVSR